MPTTLSSLRDQIRSSLEAGDTNAAAAACLIGLRQFPRWVEGHRFLGEINLGQDEFNAARSCFEAVASAEPDNATPYVGMGVVYEHEEKHREAIVAFEHALDLDQSDMEVRQELVRLYDQLHLSKVVQTTRAGLAHLHLRNRLLPQAQKEIEELLQFEPQRLDLLVARMRASWLVGKLDVAEQTARSILEVSPDCIIANLILGEMLTRTGRADQAEPFLAAVQALDPEGGITAPALDELASEGYTVDSALPRVPRDVDVPEDATVRPGVGQAPVPQPGDILTGSIAPRPSPASSTPAETGEFWAGAGTVRPTTGQQGMLDSLLKDLDQVWPDRLDATKTSRADAPSPEPSQTPVVPHPAHEDDDEALPPSFMGDVSEVIREFESPGAGQDDTFTEPAPSAPKHEVEDASARLPKVVPVVDEFVPTSPNVVSDEKDEFELSGDLLSGEHAIIDFSLPADDARRHIEDSFPTADERRATEAEMFQSAERSIIDLSLSGSDEPTLDNDAADLDAFTPTTSQREDVIGLDQAGTTHHATGQLWTGHNDEFGNLSMVPAEETSPVDERGSENVDTVTPHIPSATTDGEFPDITVAEPIRLDLDTASAEEPVTADAANEGSQRSGLTLLAPWAHADGDSATVTTVDEGTSSGSVPLDADTIQSVEFLDHADVAGGYQDNETRFTPETSPKIGNDVQLSANDVEDGQIPVDQHNRVNTPSATEANSSIEISALEPIEGFEPTPSEAVMESDVTVAPFTGTQEVDDGPPMRATETETTWHGERELRGVGEEADREGNNGDVGASTADAAGPGAGGPGVTDTPVLTTSTTTAHGKQDAGRGATTEQDSVPDATHDRDTSLNTPADTQLTDIAALLTGPRADEGLHALRSTIRSSPERASEALMLLQQYPGGSRALRAQASGDAYLTTGDYAAAVAAYADALDALRGKTRQQKRRTM